MKKILIVDDHKYALEKIQRYCVGYEAEVFTVLCYSAIAAIQAIRENEPDILFLDYSFYDSFTYEDTNGAEVARWIDRNYIKPIAVASHTARDEKEARRLFEGCRCVTHFVQYDERLCRGFLEESLSLTAD